MANFNGGEGTGMEGVDDGPHLDPYLDLTLVQRAKIDSAMNEVNTSMNILNSSDVENADLKEQKTFEDVANKYLYETWFIAPESKMVTAWVNKIRQTAQRFGIKLQYEVDKPKE